MNKFPLEDRCANIASAYGRGLTDITALIHREVGHAAIVIGGGPSVDGEVASIQRLQAAGGRILCIERMYPWCLRHGFLPDYVVTMDASDDVLPAFDALQPGSMHLVASQCRPEIFDRLAGEAVYVYGTPQTELDTDDYWAMSDMPTFTVVNGAGSVTLCALCIAMLLGMRDLHLFGFDCHVTKGPYAHGIVGAGTVKPLYGSVNIAGRTFLSTVPYMLFAHQFFELLHMAKGLGEYESIQVHGDSLVTAMKPELRVSDAHER